MMTVQQFFKVKESGSTLQTEVEASITSFVSIVYIVAVNALILSQTGMNYNSVMIATILTTAFSNILMGLYAKSPLILAPGMSDNAFFTYILVGAFAFTWQESLSIVFIVGMIFFLLTYFKVTGLLLRAIPSTMIKGMSAGVGFFLIFLGLKNSEIIVSSPDTIVALNNIFQPIPLTMLATLLMGLFLFVKNVRGNFLLTIIFGVIVSIFLGVTDISSFSYSLIDTQSLEPFIFQFDFSSILSVNYWIAVFSLLILVVFQNLGTQISFLNSEDPAVLKKTLEANGLSVVMASVLGCSSTCTSAEGATGIAIGAKTGLTSFLVGIYFLFTIILIPFIALIPLAVISALLVIVGSLLAAGNLKDIDFMDFTEYFPAILMVLMMVLTFNIADGIGWGFSFYTFLKVSTGKRKSVSKMMYVLTGVFILYFILKFM
ncbi:putative MFS transporter, AGZA family, xanthine/uracil permease [Carnobacterium iners]|uniref:Putative MFS transporter, AGZA family, xanthine/uracil permease n=1 Tax=Carnobacterium iners TaxID=1073423 RepID=A0A1X7MZG2_9LACT|nr:NCS2 family permease [Carnobacterium iners]SEK18995.1 putative MFS transporter, AGZA family, xanthine/uracil permease [Carnobacterium iners]SMH29870.1 putative MFS transporter, AGZA family, xanthine/uracil permease [Carnobacterium iners]